MIIDLLMSLFTIVVLGIGFRIRGGLFGKNIGWGATKARLISWSLPVTLLIMYWYPIESFYSVKEYINILTENEYVFYTIIFGSVFAGTVLPWWGSLDFGRHEGTWLKDFLFHSLRGILWVSGLVIIFSIYGLYIPALLLFTTGILCGIMYEIGWQIKTPFKVNREGGLNTGTEIGEVLFGSLIGLSLVLGYFIT